MSTPTTTINTTSTTASSSTRAITMDGYHQLQQKRALERQKEQEKQKKQQKTTLSSPLPPATEATPGSVRAQVSDTSALLEGSGGGEGGGKGGRQQSQLNGAKSTSTAATAGTVIDGNETPTSGNALIKTAGTSTIGTNVYANGAPHHSRKTPNAPTAVTGTGTGTGAGAGAGTGGATSPPTPVSGGTVIAAHKGTAPKGPKAIHAIELIRIAGEILQFPPVTIGTSLVYYHKYRAYLHQAYKRGERDNEATKADEYLFATACLHLACKCTEVSRKVRDLVNVTYRVMNPNQPVLSLSTSANTGSKSTDNSTTLDPIVPTTTHTSSSNTTTGPGSTTTGVATTGSIASSTVPATTATATNQQPQLAYPTAPPPTAQTYWFIRDSLLTTELMLLRILQFDLDIALPFSDVLRIYKGMGMVFTPTDEEASHIYPEASNFDVFLPALTNLQQHPHTNAFGGGQHGSSSNSSSSATTPNHRSNSTPLFSNSSLSPSGSNLAPFSGHQHHHHPNIHPTLSALVQISITFCIDALCSSTIALHSSSRALAMGSIYLAIRSAGLELPMPFEDWCFAWGRNMIATGFGGVVVVSAPGAGSGAVSSSSAAGVVASMSSTPGVTGGIGVGGPGVGTGTSASLLAGVLGATTTTTIGGGGGAVVSGTNGLLGLTTSTNNSLFVAIDHRPPPGEANMFMEGLEMTATVVDGGVSGSRDFSGGMAKGGGSDTIYSQNDSPQLSNIHSPAVVGLEDGTEGASTTMFTQPPQPLTIVDEVRKVVQELGSFYTN
ncbi:hypothetical protein BG004_002426 [Podila humilis]|nr:hypothetical protein BG004_002426 [Podila humilis]